MALNFEDAVWETEIDEIPKKFYKTQFGYHIIWVPLKQYPIDLVGVPRFELGSKRPKRPSIGQTNPYALDFGDNLTVIKFTQEFPIFPHATGL